MNKTIVYSLQQGVQGVIHFDLIDLFDKDRLTRIYKDFYSKKEFFKELRKAVDIIDIEYHQAYYSNYSDGFVFIKTNYERFYDKTMHPIIKYKEQGFRLIEEGLTYNYFISREEAELAKESLKKDIETFINRIEHF